MFLIKFMLVTMRNLVINFVTDTTANNFQINEADHEDSFLSLSPPFLPFSLFSTSATLFGEIYQPLLPKIFLTETRAMERAVPPRASASHVSTPLANVGHNDGMRTDGQN
jgi:hypothetical protein